MNRGKVFAYFCIGVLVSIASSLAVQAQNRTYSGRAAGVIVVSPSPATSGDTGQLPASGGTTTVTTPGTSLPGIVTGPIISTTSGFGTSSLASSMVSNLNMTAGGYNIRATSASVNTQCICCPGSSEASCSGRTTITGLLVTDPSGNNVPIIISGSANQVITLANGAGTITINEQITALEQITVNALHVNITSNGTTTNALIASSHSDIVCGSISPTPSDVRVAGRAVDQNGNGISQVTVSLTCSTGERTSVSSNVNGVFNFPVVRAGQTYILEAVHGRYRFEAQVLNVNEDITDLVLTGQGK